MEKPWLDERVTQNLHWDGYGEHHQLKGTTVTADPPFVLHRSDKSHPNPVGAYLAACVFYATLLDANPAGLPGKIVHGDKMLADIPDDQAKQLQEIAWRAVKDVHWCVNESTTARP